VEVQDRWSIPNSWDRGEGKEEEVEYLTLNKIIRSSSQIN